MAGEGDEVTAGRNLCLRALGIALDTTVEEGGLWYASTKNLEILCVELCLTFRACWKNLSGPILVTSDTPRHLWLCYNKPAEEEPPKNQHNKKLLDGDYRVPPLVVRALKVMDFPESIQARLSEGARSCSPRAKQQAGGLARAYRRWQHWFRRQGPLWWPDTLVEITFGGAEFNRAIAGIVWPASLRELTLGGGFNQPVSEVVWPASLQRLSFGDNFDQPVEGAVWPSGLEQLSFGCLFNKPIAEVTWPASLRRLSFRNGATQFQEDDDRFDRPDVFDFLRCEACRLHDMLGAKFNQDVVQVVWPVSLRELSFGDYFNQPLVGVTWPSSLQQLSFGRCFNQPIAGVVWPASLRQLSFRDGSTFFAGVDHRQFCEMSARQIRMGSKFNQPIDGVAWPASLQQLSFGHSFNQPIDGAVAWPTSLERLSLGQKFNQPVVGVRWAASLKHLSFGDNFNLPLAGAVWPDSLQTLTVGKSFIQPVAGIVWPPSLRLRRVWGDPPRIFGR